jgi:hypothetical protein
VVASARSGRGRVFLFGDTCFAANKNLELEDGSAPRVVRENAHFWRWFFGRLNDRPWIPPEIPPEPGDSGDDSPNDDAGSEMPPRKPSEHAPMPPTGKEGKP